MAIQIAHETGCHVTTTQRLKCGLRALLGAHRVIEYDREFRRIVSGQTLFSSDRRRHNERSCRVLRRGGTLVWLIAKAFEDVSDEYGVACRRRNP